MDLKSRIKSLVLIGISVVIVVCVFISYRYQLFDHSLVPERRCAIEISCFDPKEKSCIRGVEPIFLPIGLDDDKCLEVGLVTFAQKCEGTPILKTDPKKDKFYVADIIQSALTRGQGVTVLGRYFCEKK